MADSWFTSDFHFGHFNIIRHCNRPFTTTEEMDACIVDRMNQCVKPNDTLYFLGDFCMGSVKKIVAYRKRLPAKRSISLKAIMTRSRASSRMFLRRGVHCQRFMWASKVSFFAITRCASGCIMGRKHGSSMGTRTATCRIIRWRCQWMSGLTHTIFDRGTSRK